MKQLSNSIYFVYLTRAVELRLVARFQLTINTFRIVSESIIIYALWPCSLIRATFKSTDIRNWFICVIQLNKNIFNLFCSKKKLFKVNREEFEGDTLVSVQIDQNFVEFFLNFIFLKLMSVFEWMFFRIYSNQTIITKCCVKFFF